jgi:acetylornithine deacetylase
MNQGLIEKTVELTKELVSYPSVSDQSNEEVSQHVANHLTTLGFEVEWHSYVDSNAKTKVSLVAKRGHGTGGVCYLAHTDVVPAEDWSVDFCGPFEPAVRHDRLYGRGSCDMKGSLACALIAASLVDLPQQSRPIYFVVTSDEEAGMHGAKLINQQSAYFQEMVENETVGIVGEPTSLSVIHAHKGGQRMAIRARGMSAHTSTNAGINANYRLIPALQELLDIRQASQTDERYQNRMFDPPTLSLNMTITNEPEAVNVTPSLAQVNLFLRSMPEVDHKPLLQAIRSLCEKYQLEFEIKESVEPWQVPSDSPWIQDMMYLVGAGQQQSHTVCFATDAGILQRLDRLLVCGPGDIQQAHRSDEWISLDQLGRGVEVYRKAFQHWALAEGR